MRRDEEPKWNSPNIWFSWSSSYLCIFLLLIFQPVNKLGGTFSTLIEELLASVQRHLAQFHSACWQKDEHKFTSRIATAHGWLATTDNLLEHTHVHHHRQHFTQPGLDSLKPPLFACLLMAESSRWGTIQPEETAPDSHRSSTKSEFGRLFPLWTWRRLSPQQRSRSPGWKNARTKAVIGGCSLHTLGDHLSRWATG